MTQPAPLEVPDGRSGCPINMTMELLGDRWSLIVLRDIMFGSRTRFREILDHSLEGIASNVLASRLAKLTNAGLLTRTAVEGHRQKIDYFLTDAAIELVPMIIEAGIWGSRWLPTTPELAVRARLLAHGGPDIRDRFMAELRTIHIDHRPRPDDGVLVELDAAYQRMTTAADVTIEHRRFDLAGDRGRSAVPPASRSDSASRLVNAPVGRVFEALVDRAALETWLPPREMIGRFERFDPRPGGSYRLVLTYADPSASDGKSSADSDVVEVRYLEIVSNDRVVQAVDFVADAAEFAGTMTMTWAVSEEAGGTRVVITADDVPKGISVEDHAVGLASSLENLARFVEL